MFLLMGPPPTSDQLLHRIEVLFGAAPAPPSPPASRASVVVTAAQIERFDIGLPDPRPEPGDPAEATTAWLDTPNDLFNGLCPRNLVNGTVEQRHYMAEILSALEAGDFS